MPASSKPELDPERRRRLDKIIFYAVDKASPYALALHPSTDDLDKLSPYTLTSLSITETGTANMWLWINAYCQPDAKPIGAGEASKCKKVAEVRALVHANAS